MSTLYAKKAAKQASRAEDVAARDAADKRILTWDIEIALLDEIISILTDPSLPGTHKPPSEVMASATKPPIMLDLEKPADYRRGPKGAWRIVMPEMLRQYQTGLFRLADVEAAAELTNQDMKAETVRSQMSNYVSAGYLERVTQGVFRFTDKGRVTFAELSDQQASFVW